VLRELSRFWWLLLVVVSVVRATWFGGVAGLG